MDACASLSHVHLMGLGIHCPKHKPAIVFVHLALPLVAEGGARSVPPRRCRWPAVRLLRLTRLVASMMRSGPASLAPRWCDGMAAGPFGAG